MQLHKTEKAREALRRRADALTAHDRRILILSDGHRSLDDIVALLGAPARPAAMRLVEDRYLATSAVAAGAVPASTPSSAPPAPPPPPPSPLPAPRRSLAAAKLYVLDMLQLQRSAEAAAAQSAIHASGDREALVAAVLEGVRMTRRNATPSYGRRVLERVAEILPEDALPALAALDAAAPTARME